VTKGVDDTAESPALDKTQAATPDEVPRDPLAPGARLGSYELRERIGAGGMGVVWSAHDPDLDRLVAIKLLLHADSAPQLRTRLLREARAMARLKHQNVLTVHEVGSTGDRDYIVMELVDGTNLDAFIGTNPPREYVWEALIAAGRGLAAAHAAGLVHRDFKPHNVLRSREGRVLVTDFGLARGVVETTATPLPTSWPPAVGLEATLDATPDTTLATVPPARPHDPADLASPITQTGALIGTPAYMAPEVFMGSQPDPRTDQFAYCVTVWQALSGERPFKGQTLDELRRAALAGVEGVKANLDRRVRQILERGLAPDPAKRWPDMEALLDALECTARKPVRRAWPYALAAIGIGAAAFVLWPRAHVAPVEACELTENMLGSAWSPQIHAELARRAPEATVAIAPVLDEARRDWTAAYEEACQTRGSRTYQARVACLADARDQLEALTRMLRAAPPDALATFDVRAALPSIAPCKMAAPLAPPAPRADQRDSVLAALAEAHAMRGRPGEVVVQSWQRLRELARAAGWQPLEARVAVLLGRELADDGETAAAKSVLADVMPRFATAHDPEFEAMAQLALATAIAQELDDPADDHAVVRGKLPPQLDRALTYARSALRAAGSDPRLAGDLALLEARVALDAGQWNLAKQPYVDAAAHAREAQRLFTQSGDLRRAGLAVVTEATVYLRRGDANALDDAAFALRASSEQLEQARVEVPREVTVLRARIAVMRGESFEASKLYDRLGLVRTGSKRTVRGRVVDATGKPVPKASIIAWKGELHVDSGGAVIEPIPPLEHVLSLDDGSFTIDADPDFAITADANNVGQTDALATSAAPTFRLAPEVKVNHAAHGRMLFGVQVTARFPVGAKAGLVVHAPVNIRTNGFELDHLPSRPAELVATNASGTGTRIVRFSGDLEWSVGFPIEVIARGQGLDRSGTAWVFPGNLASAPRTRADAERMSAAARQVQWSPLVPIGADATDVGRRLYHHGDRHAVLLGNPERVTVCVAAAPEPAAAVRCVGADVHRPSIVYDYTGDRYGADVVPIEIDVSGPAAP
jgi:hypothetical protein